jgi:hypothetical protein
MRVAFARRGLPGELGFGLAPFLFFRRPYSPLNELLRARENACMAGPALYGNPISGASEECR